MKKILMMAAVCLMAVATFAAQCAATTKKGTQCKRQASPGSSYCWQHGGTTKAERAAGMTAPAPERRVRNVDTSEQAATAPVADGRCQATTKSGAQCKRKANPGSKFCWQHGATANSDADAVKVEAPVEAPVEMSADATVAGQCTAITKGGVRCRRKAKAGSDKCWQHDK